MWCDYMRISVYDLAKSFKKKYKGSVAWRIKKHCKVVEKHLNPDEEVLYVFPAQRNEAWYDIYTTAVLVMTNKRLIIGRKRLLFGYFLDVITPDMFNDMNVYAGLLWGRVNIDTIKEVVVLTNISKRALPEIETNITTYMMKAKEKLKTNL